MENIISIYNLSLADLLNKITISVEKNTFITISGPNNCGKTALIRVLNKELPYNGKIVLDNIPIEQYKIDDYYKKVYFIIPNEVTFSTNIVEEILNKYLNKKNEKKYNTLLKKLELDKLLKDLQKYMDKAASKGLIKTNSADREKSRLTQKVKNMK